MANTVDNLSKEVSSFLDDLNHPLRNEIEQLRINILTAHDGLKENIKWNGPNYCFHNNDRITMKIQPPKLIQLIFHRGVKKQEQPQDKLLNDSTGLLIWKENDRAIATFNNLEEIESRKAELNLLIKEWIKVTT